jgi:hypothetical protein
VLTIGLLMLSYTARALRMHRYFAIPAGFSRCMLVFLQHNMLVDLHALMVLLAATLAFVLPLPLVAAIFAALFAWTGKIVAHGLIIASFASVAAGPSLIGALGGELFSILPIHGPASLGTYEAGIVAAMVAIDVPFRQALNGAVNLHLVVLCVSTLAGLAAVLLPARQSRAVTE